MSILQVTMLVYIIQFALIIWIYLSKYVFKYMIGYFNPMLMSSSCGTFIVHKQELDPNNLKGKNTFEENKVIHKKNLPTMFAIFFHQSQWRYNNKILESLSSLLAQAIWVSRLVVCACVCERERETRLLCKGLMGANWEP